MGFGSRLWDLGVVGQVDKKASFHACCHAKSWGEGNCIAEIWLSHKNIDCKDWFTTPSKLSVVSVTNHSCSTEPMLTAHMVARHCTWSSKISPLHLTQLITSHHKRLLLKPSSRRAVATNRSDLGGVYARRSLTRRSNRDAPWSSMNMSCHMTCIYMEFCKVLCCSLSWLVQWCDNIVTAHSSICMKT